MTGWEKGSQKTSLQTAISAVSLRIPTLIVKMTDVTFSLFNVMSVLQNMKAAAVRNARILSTCLQKEEKNSGRG